MFCAWSHKHSKSGRKRLCGLCERLVRRAGERVSCPGGCPTAGRAVVECGFMAAVVARRSATQLDGAAASAPHLHLPANVERLVKAVEHIPLRKRTRKADGGDAVGGTRDGRAPVSNRGAASTIHCDSNAGPAASCSHLALWPGRHVKSGPRSTAAPPIWTIHPRLSLALTVRTWCRRESSYMENQPRKAAFKL